MSSTYFQKSSTACPQTSLFVQCRFVQCEFVIIWMRKKIIPGNIFLARATICVEFHILLMSAGFFSRCSSFLPHSKAVHIWFTGVSTWWRCEWVGACGSLRVHPATGLQTVWGWFSPYAPSCQDGLWPLVTLNWNKGANHYLISFYSSFISKINLS